MLSTAETDCLLLREARTTNQKAVNLKKKCWKSVQYSSAARFTDLQPAALFMLILAFLTNCLPMSSQSLGGSSSSTWKSGVIGKPATGLDQYVFTNVEDFMFAILLIPYNNKSAHFSQGRTSRYSNKSGTTTWWWGRQIAATETGFSKKMDCEVVLRAL